MKTSLKIALGYVLLHALTACGLSPEEYMVRAEESFESHQFKTARLDLMSVLETKPGDAEALDLLARTQLEIGDAEGAIAALDKLEATGKAPPDAAILRGDAELLRDKPENAINSVAGIETGEAWRIRALAAVRRKDAGAAAKAFAAGKDAAGPKARLLAEYARFVLSNGDRERAHQLAQAASKEDATALEPLLAQAQIAASAGRPERAYEAYDKAARLWPENRAALIGRVASLGDMGRIEEMEPLLDDLAANAADDVSVVYLQARLAAARKDWPASRALLQRVEPEIASVPMARLLYGQALVRSGQTEQAMSQLRSYLLQDPSNVLALRLLAEAQLTSGDATGAMATLQPVVAGVNPPPEALAVMAAAAKASGSSNAGEYLKRARDAASAQIGRQLVIADAALRRKEWQVAASAYRNLLEPTGGENAMVLNNLAYAESQLGNDEEAIEFALKALAMAPDNASVLDTAGWLLVETGKDRKRGTELLRKAARLAPENAAIRQHLNAASKV